MTSWKRFCNPSDVSDDIAQIIAEQDRQTAEKAEFSRHVWGEFKRVRIVALSARPGTGATSVTLTHSTYPNVKYQVTRWDGAEPFGHLDAQSRKSAIDELWYYAGMTGWRERWLRRD